MPKQRTVKVISKRVRLTKTGKIKHKRAGQGHFNARESGNTTRMKRRLGTMSKANERNIRRAIGM
ncbi:MAG: 50S ribosomal protein L35 [Patescibacteria group bacterium]